MYEGGLRIGEALGLLWEDCWMGRDDTDATRHLKIQRQVDGNGRAIPLTKSGRTRQVAMSRRLRTMLLEYRMAQGRPEDSERVVGLARSTARKLLGTACKQAKLEPRKFKDFRDTFASLLVQHGISLTWVSMQLGHASVQTTQAHYARWLPRDGYTNPWQVPPGGVPTDLFAALDSGGVPGVSLCVPGTGETQ